MACTISPDDIKKVKGLGYLHNKGTDCFSARVLTGNGKVTAAQLSVIAEAAEKFGGEHYLYDGVHPDVAGAALIAGEWLKAFEKMEK